MYCDIRTTTHSSCGRVLLVALRGIQYIQPGQEGGWGGHQIEKKESKYAVMNIITGVVAVTWCSLFHTINVAYKYLGMLLTCTVFEF